MGRRLSRDADRPTMAVRDTAAAAARAPSAADQRDVAARVVALALQRRDAARLVDRIAPPALPGAAVHPVTLFDTDPLAAAIGAALRSQARPWRRLEAPPAGGGHLDAAFGALDATGRAAVVLRWWLDWGAVRVAAALGLAPAEAAAVAAAARAQLPATDDEVAGYLQSRAAAVAVPPRRSARRRPPVLPVAAVGALVALLALAVGAVSAPLPDVAGDAPDPPALVDAAVPVILAAPAAPLEPQPAAAGPGLAWQEVALPSGVAFRWVAATGDGFVALGVRPEEATEAVVAPVGFWESADGVTWAPVAADASSFGQDHVVAGMAAGADGLVVVGGERHPGTPGALARPAAWRLAPGAPAWQRAGLRTAPMGFPVATRWVFRDLAVTAGNGDYLVTARAEIALTGRQLPDGLTYRVDEFGATLLGPGGAPISRATFGDLGIDERAASRLVTSEPEQVAWLAADGLRWEPLPVDTALDLGAVRGAGDGWWAPAATGLWRSADGVRWTEVDLAATGFAGRDVAMSPAGMLVATGGRSLLVAGAEGWSAVSLPPTRSHLVGARHVVSGAVGAAAYGTMGSDVGEVVAPAVTVPGTDGALHIDLLTGAFEVVGRDGTSRVAGTYRSGGNFRVSASTGEFVVVDESGMFRLRGRLADWDTAIRQAFRTPYPPNGEVALWFSPDGERWRLQQARDGFGARGLPVSVAAGTNRVVVAAANPPGPRGPAGAALWVGAPPG